MNMLLKEIADIISGGTPKTSVVGYWNGNIPWISIKDFNFGNIYIDATEKSITKLGLNNSSTNLLLDGDIIISARGTVGCLAIIKKKMAFNQSCYGIRVKDTNKVDPKYLFWFLKNTINVLKSKAHGSVFDTIIKPDLENFQVYLPDFKTQKRISRILDYITKKIEINNIINNNLYDIGKQIVMECEKKSSNKVELVEIMNFINGFAFKNKDYNEQGKYRIITIKNVQDGFIDSTKTDKILNIPVKMNDNCILKIGDSLISLTGNIGRVGIVYEEKMLLNQRVAKINCNNKKLLPYIYFMFSNSVMRERLKKISRGTAQQNLSPVETLKLKIKYDYEIIKPYISILNTIYNSIIKIKIENKKLEQLRDTLLPKLMNGEIDLDNIEI